MLKRFVELEDAIRATLAFADRNIPTISAEDWTLFKRLCQVLQPFEEITASMSGEKYITGSSVIVVTRCLKEACQRLINRGDDLLPDVLDTVLLLKSGLEERFRLIETSGTFALCTFMDPRFKMQGFSDQSEATRTKEKVRKLVAALIAEKEHATVPIDSAVSENDNPDGPDNNRDISPWDIFDKMVASSTTQGTPQSKAIKEVDMYLSDEILPRRNQKGNLTCPLEWWRKHQYVYQN
ncbi:unnamed protein product [Chilo suppressalis]|uniref:HAT C-terminal dimerisation domain-containing protein n=1 Tax=Chilo suppressalis TaxID=168631 RepID=A0ABN8B6E1_CHISP|nr:unnamed protein product [Chilo suppressalis]